VRRAKWRQLDDLSGRYPCAQCLDDGVDEHPPGLIESLLILPILLAGPAE